MGIGEQAANPFAKKGIGEQGAKPKAAKKGIGEQAANPTAKTAKKLKKPSKLLRKRLPRKKKK